MSPIIDVLARHEPGFDVYGPVLDFQGDELGHGRIRACQEVLIQQHLHILNRIMCQEAGRNFSDVQDRSTARFKRAKLGSPSFMASVVVTRALFRLEVLGDKTMWDDIRAIL